MQTDSSSDARPGILPDRQIRALEAHGILSMRQ